MGNNEPTLNGLLTFTLLLVFFFSMWYFFIFQNFMEVALAVWGWDFYPVESQLWYLILGWILIASVLGAMRVFEYSRRGQSIKN